jgi:hypothetical protein
MSLSILLLGWVAVSILLSPVIGRFMAMQGESDSRVEPCQVPATSSIRIRHNANATVRRNVAIQLSRRDTSWPRIG